MQNKTVVLAVCLLLVAAATAANGTVNTVLRSPTTQVGAVKVEPMPTFAVPQHMNLQGYLTDAGGAAINGSKSMRFDIFRGGSSVWNETQTVDVQNGLFAAVMGSATPIPYSVFEPGTACSLELTVEGQALSPRVEITSVGHAYRSVKSDTAEYAVAGSGWSDGGHYVATASDQGRGIRMNSCTMYNGRVIGTESTHVCFGVACTTGRMALPASPEPYATVGGGMGNRVSYSYSTVCGGDSNKAHSSYAVVSGGHHNYVSGAYATIAGGREDSVAGNYGFAAGLNSTVRSLDTNSVAFNGTTTSGDRQTRVYNLVEGFSAMGIDHPLDPHGKILNQYSVGSSEAMLIYRGAATIGSDGRVTASLPDYFDALCRNPMVQLTGVGTSDVVYVAEDVSGNHFSIGGKPGTKVYWAVTAEREDEVAEQARRAMPVEQAKTDGLAGRSVNGLW